MGTDGALVEMLEVINKVEQELKGDMKTWANYFITKGLKAFE